MTMRIVIEGREIRPPTDYQVDRDMLEPADTFSMTMPLDAFTVSLATLDAEYQLVLDDTAIMSGWLDEVEETDDGRLLIRGMDKSGRLVTTSIPGAGMTLASNTVQTAAQRIIEPIISDVIFSNAENRRLTRGRGKKTKAGREPALSAAQRRQIPRRYDGGTKRWEALMGILEPLRLLSWTTGDGERLVIASPNYTQVPQYAFAEGFKRSNVIRMSRRRSIADRHSTIEVSGSGRPRGVPLPAFFPAFPGQRRPKYISRNRTGVADDATGDFKRQKRLFVVSEAMNQDEAQELAERALSQGLVNAEQISVTVPDHGQPKPGTSLRTLYTFDTIATVRRTIETAPGNDRETALIDRDYYVTKLVMRSGRDGGEQTSLTLGPIGAALS